MSYILEALKKAEQQRELGQVPGIDSAHEQTPGPVSRRWLWLGAGVLAVNVVLVLMLIWPQAEPEVVAAPAQPVQPQPAVTLAAPETEIQPAAVARRPAAELPAVTQPSVAPVPQVEPEQPRRVARRDPVPVAPPEPVVELPAVTAPVEVPARTRLSDTSGYKAPRPVLPVWPQIPGNLFQQLKGGLRLDVHVYSDEPAARFVLINLQKYFEGERLQEGPLLDEITYEGVILSFRGQQFLVPAQ